MTETNNQTQLVAKPGVYAGEVKKVEQKREINNLFAACAAGDMDKIRYFIVEKHENVCFSFLFLFLL